MANTTAQDFVYPASAAEGVPVSELPAVLAATSFNTIDGESTSSFKLQPRLPTIRVEGRILYLPTSDKKQFTFLVAKNDAAKVKEAIEASVKPLIVDAAKATSPPPVEEQEKAIASSSSKKRKVLKPVSGSQPSPADPSFSLQITDDQHDPTMSRIYVRYSEKNLTAIEVKGDSYEELNVEVLQTADFKEQDGHPFRYREVEAVLSPSPWISQSRTSCGITWFLNNLVVGPQNEFIEQAIADQYKVEAPRKVRKWKGKELTTPSSH